MPEPQKPSFEKRDGGASPTPRKRALKKGFMLNSFPGGRKNIPVMEMFRMLKEAGFDGAEPSSSMALAEILKARDATGLQIAGLTCGEHTRLFSSASAAERQQGVDGLLRSIENARTIGAESVLVVPGGVNERVSYLQNYARTREQIQKSLRLAEKLGVVLALENVWNNFLLSPMEAARYVDDFKSPAIGWHFDVGNVMAVGWPEQWIRILGKRIRAVHIKEFSRKKMKEDGARKGFAVEYLQGDNNWPVVMKALDEIGYAGWATVEDACGECKQQLSPEAYLRRVSSRLDRILAA